jgi:hypothetical protein
LVRALNDHADLQRFAKHPLPEIGLGQGLGGILCGVGAIEEQL